MNRYELAGKADDMVVRAIREIYDHLESLKGMLTKAAQVKPKSEPAPSQSGLAINLGSPVQISAGAGSPEGKVIGNKGDLYVRNDGGAGTSLYVKESGTSTSTGWMGY